MSASARSLRWLIALVAIRAAGFAVPPPSEKAVTVTQLDQLIGQIKDENDAKAVRELSNLRLLERAGFSHLARWESTLRGPRARRALLASVDASALLAPPATEIPSAVPPDEPERHQILAHVNEFVKQAKQKMPDFLAARETVSFEVATKSRMESQGQTDLFGRVSKPKRSYLQVLGPAEASGGRNAQLFWLGTTTQAVTYRDGKETSDAGVATVGVKNPLAISSVGEFGQVLVNLFSEIATEDIAWDHWEDGGTGRIAVFHYSVPRERSRFSLTLSEDEAPDYPAHHGEFAVDTASGAILRVSLIAQVRSFWQEEIGVVVEFGPTQIGRTLAISPDGSLFTAQDHDKENLRIYHMVGGASVPQLIHTISEDPDGRRRIYATDTYFSPDSRSLLIVTSRPEVRLFNTSTWEQEKDATLIAQVPSDMFHPQIGN